MNGRLYDPLLRRFLNADENIQDPYNTQNYNKYGYVMNNPLMFSDPSGEFIFAFVAAWGLSALWATVTTGAIIGAAIGLATYSLGVAFSGGQWKLGGALKSMFWGAVGGAVTAGIGNCFTTSASAFTEATKFAKTTLGVLTQAGAHAVAQGTLALMQGGTFQQAFFSAALGSLAASGFGAVAGDWAGKAGGQIFFGALAGGVGAELTGGNFWQGAITGGIVAGLNHTFHSMQTKSTANVYVETDGVGHVFVEIDGTVYSYGRYDGSYSPASGSLAPLGDGVLLKLEGENAQNFIAERNAKYPTDKYSVKVDGAKVKAYYNKLYNSGTPLTGKDGYYKYGRAIDTYNLLGPGGNNCTTITYKALNYGGANIRPAQTPAGMRYDFQQLQYYKQGYNPSQHIWGPK